MALPEIPQYPTLKMKRGDTFLFPFRVWQDPEKGILMDISSATFKAQIRKGSSLVAELSFEVTDAANGAALVKYVGDTTTWPTGDLKCDIEFTDNGSGQKLSSETFIVRVEKDITFTEPTP